MNIAISQPTFLPWCGYISLIDYVDEIIFLDNFQFEKRSWQQRNFIKTSEGAKIVTIPVETKNKYNQIISDVKIDYSSKFIIKNIRMIEQSYSKAKYFRDYSPNLFNIFLSKPLKLIDLNIKIISWICEILNIDLNYSLSSNLETMNKKGFLIEEICLKKKAKKYISTIGAKNYLNSKEEFFKKTNTELNYYEYINEEYTQLYGSFKKNLSVIDLMFNNGPRSKDILRKNFKLI